MSAARRFAVDEHPERHDDPRRRRPHHEVDVAGVETEGDPPVGFVEHARAALDRPLARERPLVELQSVRRNVRVGFVEPWVAREVLRLLVPEVGLGRLQPRPVGLCLEALVCDGDEGFGDALAPGFPEQLLDDPFALLVPAFAEVVVLDPAFGVADVDRRPVVVVECAPDAVVAVERDRVVDPHVGRGPADVVDVSLERELGRVHADDDEALVAVLLVPRPDIAERPEPVDARVGPEVDEDDLPGEARRRQRLRVEPAGDPVEGGQLILVSRAQSKQRPSRLHGYPTTPAGARSTAAAAVMMTSATASGCETMITCEPSASVIAAPARSAMERTTSAPPALSPVATTAQDGKDFHAGGPDGSENADSAAGRCVAAMTAACSAGRSAANASWNFSGSIASSTAGSAPSPFG